jgi:hypothetical protein
MHFSVFFHKSGYVRTKYFSYLVAFLLEDFLSHHDSLVFSILELILLGFHELGDPLAKELFGVSDCQDLFLGDLSQRVEELILGDDHI